MFSEKLFGRREHENKPIAQVTFDMARHSLKTKLSDGREPLSTAGMYEAVKAGQASNHYEQVVSQANRGKLKVDGSPRERTTQSSLFRTLGQHLQEANLDNVDPEDIVRWLEEGDAIESTKTDLLNFQVGEGKYQEEIHKSVKDGRYFQWIVEESDQLALSEKQDPDKVTPLTIQAANFATFIESAGWLRTQEILESGEDKTQLHFSTSHQGVLESFLYKVVKMKGTPAELDEILEKIGSGFSENEGFYVDYKRKGKNIDDWEVTVRYQDKEFTVLPNDLRQIITEGSDFKQKLKEQREG